MQHHTIIAPSPFPHALPFLSKQCTPHVTPCPSSPSSLFQQPIPVPAVLRSHSPSYFLTPNLLKLSHFVCTMDPNDNPFPPPNLDIGMDLPEGIPPLDAAFGAESNGSGYNQQGASSSVQNNEAVQDDNDSQVSDEFPLIDLVTPDYHDPLSGRDLFTRPHGTSLFPVWIPTETEGFRHGQNSCYFNSALQCLMHSPPFASIFLNHHGAHKAPPASARLNKNCVFCVLEELTEKMLLTRSSPRILKACATNIYNKTPQIFAEEGFEKKEQQDSGKFLKNLLLMLGTIESGRRCGDLTMKPLNELLSTSIFQTCSYTGMYKTTCTNCNHVTVVSGPGFILPLMTAQADSVDNLLKVEAGEQTLDGFACTSCRAVGMSKRKFSMTRAPSVLIIRLERSGLGSGDKGGIEPHLKCRYESSLNISVILEEAQGLELPQAQYQLTGVVSYKPQKGPGDRYDWDDDFRTGRYMNYVKSSRNEWTRKHDDKKKKMTVEKQVLEQHAFLLFYVREGSHSPPPSQEEQEEVAAIQPLAQSEASRGQPQAAPLQPQGSHISDRSFSLFRDLLLQNQNSTGRNGEAFQIPPELIFPGPGTGQHDQAEEETVRQGVYSHRGSGSEVGQNREQRIRQVSSPSGGRATRSARFYRSTLPLVSGRYYYPNEGGTAFEIISSAEIVAEAELVVPDLEQGEEQQDRRDVDLRHGRTRARRNVALSVPQQDNGDTNNEGNETGVNIRDENENQPSNDEDNENVTSGGDNSGNNGNNRSENNDNRGRHPSFSIQLRERNSTGRARGFQNRA